MDLGKMSLAELRRLQSKVETEIRRRSDTTRRDLLKRMQKMAAEQGMSLDDLLPAAATATEQSAAPRRGRKPAAKKAATPPVIKFRHPENPDIGWSGRGRKPQWANDWIAQGKKMEELAV
jgi:DNA-binding protein H-NS